MKILAIIPARGQSKSILRKNIAKIGDKPLIAWTIEASLKSKYISKTIVSSEDSEILMISKKYGADILVRPKEYAEDNSSIIDVIKDTINQLGLKSEKFDVLVLLQPTSPLRDVHDIETAFNLFFSHKATGLISGYEPEKTPYKSFKINNEGWLEGMIDNKSPFINRQQLPKTFYPNGAIFIVNINEFIKNDSLFTSRTIPFVMSPEKNIDIDTMEDIDKITKKIIENKHNK